MYKNQVRLFKQAYMINHNENEAEKKNISHRYDVNRPKPRPGQK